MRPAVTHLELMVGTGRGVALVALVALMAAPLSGVLTRAAADPVGQVTEFSTGISANGALFGIAAGPDGDLWFTEITGNRIGRITPSGTVTEFSTGISADSYPAGIAAGPDDNLWFTEQGCAGCSPAAPSEIGRITPSGTVTEFSTGVSANSQPVGIAAGPDGNLFFTEASGDRIGRITPSGTVTEFSAGLSPDSFPTGITAGPDGNLWFTETHGDRIGRITPSGTVTEFSAGISPGAEPDGIATGPDGNLWFTEANGDRIGRITPSGTVTEFSAGLSPGAEPIGITAGPDGNLWFTQYGASFEGIGRITPSGTVTEFSAGISTDSEPDGIAAGPDGNLWFTEDFGNRVAKIGSGTAASVPGAPTGVSGAPGNGQVTVSWSAPAFGPGISGYTATALPGGQSCSWTSGPLSCAVNGVTNGTAYTFTVTATNSVGTGSASVVSASVTPGFPSAPLGVVAAGGDGQATVSWSAPAGDGGFAITGYTATVSPGGATCTWTSGPLSCVVTGLSDGTNYSSSVTATTTNGTGPAGVSNTVTPEPWAGDLNPLTPSRNLGYPRWDGSARGAAGAGPGVDVAGDRAGWGAGVGGVGGGHERDRRPGQSAELSDGMAG